MNKIEYPSNIDIFNTQYYKKLQKSSSIGEAVINTHLNNILYNNSSLTLETLITLPFEELISLISDFETYINGLNANDRNDFKDLFIYDKNQPIIASFFMYNKDIKLSSCYYCNIDFINSFNNLSAEYVDDLDFSNRAKEYELIYIHNIGKKRAEAIIEKRKNKKFIKKTIPKYIKDDYDNMVSKIKYNHFTLDHILPQSKYPFFSLCLYNFVPSCYACNSKFKKAREFDEIENLSIGDLKYIIPSSKEYSLNKDFEFKPLCSNSKNISAIQTINDYVLSYSITRNEELIEKYLEMFKIFGRYLFHKEEVLKLIEKKVKYPDSKIENISKLMNVSVSEIKKDIYGRELFDIEETNKPLVKYKRDIAKNLGIKDVL
jgi:hypothetical protein